MTGRRQIHRNAHLDISWQSGMKYLRQDPVILSLLAALPLRLPSTWLQPGEPALKQKIYR